MSNPPTKYHFLLLLLLLLLLLYPLGVRSLSAAIVAAGNELNPINGKSVLSLAHLDLESTGLTDNGAEYVAKILSAGNQHRRSCGLLELRLTGNLITDKGVTVLSKALMVNESLRTLDMVGCCMGAAGRAMLDEAGTLMGL